MLKSFIKKTPSTPNVLSQQVNLSVERGMAQQRGERGTRRTMRRWVTFSMRRLLLPVNIAIKKLLSLDTVRETSIVHATVKGMLERQAVSTMKRENVSNAVLPLASINIQKLNTVVALAQVEQQEVYCLTVPTDACFSLSDGTIVSNCDSIGYLAMGVLKYNKPVFTQYHQGHWHYVTISTNYSKGL